MLLACVALLSPFQGAEITIAVQMKDGNTVTGSTDVSAFQFETNLGKIDVRLKDVARLQFNGAEVLLGTHDGTTIRGKISQESWKVKTRLGEFTLKSADMQMLTVTGMRAPPPAPRPSPTPAAPPAPAAPATPPKPVGVAPSKTLKLGAAITRTLRSPDGKTLYLLDASDAKIHVVKTDTLVREKEIALAGGETSMALAPGGGTILAGGKRTISSVSLAQGKMTRTFSIELDVADLCATDEKTALVGGPGGLAVVSIEKQAVVSRTHAGGTPRFLVVGDRRRIYVGGSVVLLPDKAAGRAELAVSHAPRSIQGGEFNASPDGRFAVSPYGHVYRLAKSFVADFAEVAKVEPHWASAWSPVRKRLYLVTASGFVKEIDTETWELARSWQLGYRLTDAFVDEAGGALVGVGEPAPPTGGRDGPRHPHQAPGLGDLHRFPLPD